MLGKALPTWVRPLNDEGYADYMWQAHNKSEVHVERKTWGELGDLDKVENQLRRHLTNQPKARLVFLLEGVVSQTPQGYMVCKETKSKGRSLFVGTKSRGLPLSLIQAWLYRISDYCEVLQTHTFEATMGMICAMYKSDQKEEHTTFARYYKHIEWNPNPQVERLVGLANGVGLGPVKAEALIAQFGTVWNVLNVEKAVHLTAVPGIGEQTAVRLLRLIGRPDV